MYKRYDGYLINIFLSHLPGNWLSSLLHFFLLHLICVNLDVYPTENDKKNKTESDKWSVDHNQEK